MAIFGDLVKGAMGGFPKKPVVPPWQDIVLGEQQQKAIEANKQALPGAEQLVSETNKFTQEQITQLLKSVIPNYGEISTNISQNLAAMTKGEIPSDIQGMLQTNAAAKALGGGYGGSGMQGNLLARDLGLTSLAITQQGLNSAESWLNTVQNVYGRSMMDVTSMFISPMQQFTTTMENQTQKWNVDWLKNQLKAIPDPETAAIASDVGSLTDTFATIVLGAINPGLALAYQGSSGGAPGSVGGGGGGNFMSMMGGSGAGANTTAAGNAAGAGGIMNMISSFM